MKFLKVNTNNSLIIKDFFVKNKDIQNYSYDMLVDKFLDEYYWPSNSLEKSLTTLYNWECTTLISLFNNKKESELFFDKWSEKYNQKYHSDNFFDKLLFQIIYHKPDILYIQEIWQYSKEFISKIRYLLSNIIIVGWNCSIKSKYQLDNLTYSDIVYTCSLEIKNQMQNVGINTKYIEHAFDSSILEQLYNEKKKYDVVFIGSLIDPLYKQRVNLLKYLLNEGIDITIFGNSNDDILKKYCKKSLFGIDLYKIYKSSKIVLNVHASNDIRYSGNIRIYEVTGVGSFLLTDYREDMDKRFILGKEVVTYKSFDEILKQIKYYLLHNYEREAIAKAGQIRTLSDYSYEQIAKSIYQSINEFKSIDKTEVYLNIIQKKSNKNYQFSLQMNNFLKKIDELNISENKFILYGYGTIGKIIYEKYKDNIEYVVDGNFNNIDLDNIIDPKKINLLDTNNDIFISVLGREEEIKKILFSLGIEKNRIKTIEM